MDGRTDMDKPISPLLWLGIISYSIKLTNFSSYKWSNYVTKKTELNDLRIVICLRKSEVTVEIISVCGIFE